MAFSISCLSGSSGNCLGPPFSMSALYASMASAITMVPVESMRNPTALTRLVFPDPFSP